MARGEWGYGGGRGSGCSYKRTTLIVCSVNIIIALYVLRSLYASLYIYSSSNNGMYLFHLFDICIYIGNCLDASLIMGPFRLSLNFSIPFIVVNYTPDQIRKMEESIRVRRAKEPAELVKLVNNIPVSLYLFFSSLFFSKNLRLLMIVSGYLNDLVI